MDTMWVLVAAGLVLLMQVGFMLLEAGLVRSKNSINVAQKNLFDFAFSVVTFAAVGFMFAFGAASGFGIGLDSSLFLLSELDAWGYAIFAFQVMFCGTAATIVSGAVAERMKLPAYVWSSVFTAGLIYPVFTHWAWGNLFVKDNAPFLADMGFVDFAGSTVVHGTGAWIALAACLVIGPRLGRFDRERRPVRIQGHSAVLATSGALLLFVGWIGFNGGSALGVTADLGSIIANTVLAAASGTAAGYFIGVRQNGFILPEKSISGLLGGLVAVTAGCQVLDTVGAVAIGLVGGGAAVWVNHAIERHLRIDDAVGAIGVHGIAGLAGTLGLALLAPAANLPLASRLEQLGVQALGAGLNFVWAFGMGFLFLSLLGRVVELRISPEREASGMNETEHGTRLGIGHVEEALGRLIEGKADLNLRLPVIPGDDSERLTSMFNALMDSIQNEELAQIQAADAARSREEAERLSALANATFEAIVISVDGRIVDGNAALEDLLGLPITRLKGRDLSHFLSLDDREELLKHLDEAESHPRELTVLHQDGTPVPVEMRTRMISYRGVPTRVTAVIDLRERKKAEAQILHLAQHDPLTDLPNRAVFNKELEAAIDEARAAVASSALLLIDLDRFKDINDLHGHLVGDRVIRVTAERLRQGSRRTDTVARLGGDEFAVIQRNIDFVTQAEDMAHRLLDRLSAPIDCGNGLILRAGASIGISVIPAQGGGAETIVSNADIALYEAKHRGRNAYCLFKDGMGDLMRRRRELEADLDIALEKGQFELHFQPRLQISDARIASYEALIRWNHPDKGLINPADFIPVAEGSGQILGIGKWVLDEALTVAARHLGEARISVNVSPLQFRENGFADAVEEAIDRSGLPPSRLELEITENLLIEDDARALSILRKLKAKGIRIALDDFGVGYSSLGYLSRFPFDAIKIDRSFVVGIHTNANALAIVETVARLGHALGMEVVAEGIEREEELRIMIDKGCDEIQGFLVGRPKPIGALERSVPPPVGAILASLDGATRTTPDAHVAQLKDVNAELKAAVRAGAGARVKRPG
ncbi:Ammonium transporter, putative [Polymorphum gilvum SL003B-26A1]|uniref:Ammonium transporter, putative n=2 Tax=Polymorphum TaxID=991903 RepID=F2J021_POLGS|nr:Ammonium transporter, putative [Polymorphum gilvum SL003B-26A1]